MTSTIIRRLGVFAVSLLFVALARQAQAAPIYSCPNLSACNGATYAVEVSQVGDDYTLDFWINTTGYNGGAGDYIKAIALKNLVGGSDVDDITGETLVLAPGGVANWDLKFNELNANGCAGGNDKNFCAQAIATFNDGKGHPFTIGDELQWRFTFTYPDTLGPTVHVKYLYVDSKGDKRGDLGSFDLNITTTEPPCTTCVPDDRSVPEPAALTLLGLGLAFGASRFRRRR